MMERKGKIAFYAFASAVNLGVAVIAGYVMHGASLLFPEAGAGLIGGIGVFCLLSALAMGEG
ncbi:MAG: hypothetical protein ACI4P0_00725 [Mailhella sp.]